ncbi:low temperature requirement protein A [Enterococcus faecium]|uniref:low temperature requirement protein A n=1 Tax=Enterococcus faecium TaxID=1352 RepID=UPI000B6E45AD|nr:low temperature requirement protein A [Enterococcus faecium]OTN91539.1 hypothetical protein A5809_000904 [Enterococcus faecium]
MIKHKKVELTELFYDLVYVYTISQITSLIHHTHQGIITPSSILNFSLELIIFVNSWMVQTVFTNRYGKNSLTNIFFMFGEMAILLAAATRISSALFSNFSGVILLMAGISFLLLLQYIVAYKQVETAIEQSFIKRFFYILGIRTSILLIAAFLPYRFGIILAAIGVIGTWLLPGILVSSMKESVPINFPHLIERLSLFTIITFGEMIIGIAPFFGEKQLSIWSFVIFSIVVSLFMVYIVEIDHLIDTNYIEDTWVQAIYYHYFIFFGLSFITVSLSFLGKTEVSLRFTTLLLYLGIGLFLMGTFFLNRYNKRTHLLNKQILSQMWLAYFIGFLGSFLIDVHNSYIVMAITFLVTGVIAVRIITHNIQSNQRRNQTTSN